MGSEKGIDEIRRMMNRHNATYGGLSNELKSFEEAVDYIRDEMQDELKDYLQQVSIVGNDDIVRDKETFRKNKNQLVQIVEKSVYRSHYEVEGYDDKDDFIDDAAEELIGRSILSHAFEDDAISDIYCMSWDNIWVEKNGVNEPYPYKFRSSRHYESIVKRILQHTDNSEISEAGNPIVHTTYYEDRIAVTDKSITPTDYSLTIRKHKEDHITLEEIIKGGVFNQEIADILGLAIRGESNLIYAGITGSGKTTSVRALLDHYASSENKRMIVAEDTQELFPENSHTVEMKTNPKNNTTLTNLIELSLRLKPKYIVVGEVRGVEAEAAVEAMATGHSTIFTMHGGNAWDIINRLITKYLTQMPELAVEVVERIVGNAVDYIIVQDDIPGIGRRISSIKEVSYDFKDQTARLVPIVEYDFATDTFVHVNKISPDKASYMMRRGIAYDELKDYIRETDAEYIASLDEYKQLKNEVN